MVETRWRTIPEFPRYEVSDRGEIYNTYYRQMMRTSLSTHGHVKINLTDDRGQRHTRSVALLVANAFVRPPNHLCDYLILLDGNLERVEAVNLAWRPRWFAWRYTHQLKVRQPVHYRNLMVRDMVHNFTYNSIVEAGIEEGLLFDDIWRSTYTDEEVFPTGAVFEVTERV